MHCVQVTLMLFTTYYTATRKPHTHTLIVVLAHTITNAHHYQIHINQREYRRNTHKIVYKYILWWRTTHAHVRFIQKGYCNHGQLLYWPTIQKLFFWLDTHHCTAPENCLNYAHTHWVCMILSWVVDTLIGTLFREERRRDETIQKMNLTRWVIQSETHIVQLQ